MVGWPWPTGTMASSDHRLWFPVSGSSLADARRKSFKLWLKTAAGRACTQIRHGYGVIIAGMAELRPGLGPPG